MRNQTIKFARLRLLRWDACKVYSYEISWNARIKRRAGAYGRNI